MSGQRRRPGGLLGDLGEVYGLKNLDGMAPDAMRAAAGELGLNTTGLREMLELAGAAVALDFETLTRIGEAQRRRLAEELELKASIMSDVPGFERIIERCRAAKSAQTESLATALGDLVAATATAAAEAETVAGELSAYADLVASDDEALGAAEAASDAESAASDGDESGDGDGGGDQDGGDSDGGDGGSGDGGSVDGGDA